MSTLMVLGAVGSFAVSVLHLWIARKGAPAYRFFGAGEEMARRAEQGSPGPTIITLGIAAVFALFGWYALAGAELVPALPFQTVILWAIGGIFTLRGLAVLAEVVLLSRGRGIPPQNPWFSLASLSIGLVHLLGMAQGGGV